MSTLAVVTKSFRPDFELCAALNASVVANSPPSVRHDIIVPRGDLELFRRLEGPRTRILDEREYLPRSLVPLPRVNFSVNLRQPFPPLRGWILQQLVKFAAAARSEADVVLVADSDVQFIRPFTGDTFRRDDIVRFYRRPDEVDAGLPRHVIWQQGSRALLGRPGGSPPYPDYVAALVACDPVLVRRLLEQVERVSGRRWTEAIGRQLHFSEWTLYGAFVDEVVEAKFRSFGSVDSLCHAYWDEVPMDEQQMAEFLSATRPDDVAVMVSAKSRTPMAVRRAAFSQFAARW